MTGYIKRGTYSYIYGLGRDEIADNIATDNEITENILTPVLQNC